MELIKSLGHIRRFLSSSHNQTSVLKPPQCPSAGLCGSGHCLAVVTQFMEIFTCYLGQASGTVAKLLVRAPTAHVTEPGFESCIGSQLQVSANAYLGGSKVMAPRTRVPATHLGNLD